VSAPRTFAAAASRLAALAVLLLLGAGCPEDSSKVAPRVNAARSSSATSAKRRQRIAADFCDVAHAPGKGPLLALPPLADGAKAPASGGALWVNFWATWCKPCVAELPLLSRWPARLRKRGVAVRLLMLSADSSPAALRAFRARRRKRKKPLPDGARLAEPSALASWLQKYGLGAQTAIPVHLFVGADRRVRCVRAATLRSSDYPRVAAMLAP
jgi:thiol-disulfide isomerase/thioredoxin